jgi:hypothetical protein
MDCMFNAESLSTTVLSLVVLTVVISSFRKRSPFPLPPGPRGYPVVGNLVDMPSHQTPSWLTFAKWGEIYGTYLLFNCSHQCHTEGSSSIGDICSVTVLGQTIVIINSAQIASDMLAGKSSIYSDRPRAASLSYNLTRTDVFYRIGNDGRTWRMEPSDRGVSIQQPMATHAPPVSQCYRDCSCQ